MKKESVFCLLILLLLFITPLVIAAENQTFEDENSKVNSAYDCLEEKVKDKCSTSLEENIFVLLAIDKCDDEVIEKSDDDKCWPKSDCDIKTTAQAILALDKSGHSTSDAEDWLISKNNTPSDIVWYLEIDSPKETLCSITYNSVDYTINIGEDKEISSSAGSCLSLSDSDYWLRISPTCYDNEFQISCDEQFITTLLFREKSSSVIHVSEETSSSSAEGTTTEKVSSFCFTEGDTCDYEGSLWATLVLDQVGYDVSSFIPYLITMAGNNDEYLPEAFLYALTGYTDFRSDLLLKQKSQYWDESGDKFYDTAIALYPFQYEEPTEKANSIEWLLEIQGKDGCWDGGNLKSNAFILYSLWPKGYFSSTGGSTGDDCVGAGYYCMPGIECQGNILESYECSGVAKCCDAPKQLELCKNQGGKICFSTQRCAGGIVADAADTEYGEECCIGGTCEERVSDADCESYGGICRTYECNNDEEESSSYTCDYGDMCCVKKSEEKSYWWIWLLVILIILIIIAIIFRDKVGVYYYRIKYKFGKGKSKPEIPPSAFPTSPRRPIMNQRKIFPPSRNYRRPPLPSRKPSEMDEVLKKLKEIGK